MVALGSPAGATDGWAYDLADELMSPYCPGRALSECPSDQAAELRRWIIAQEEAGVAREDVEAALFGRYGDQLLQAPRPEGMGLWAYLVPALALVLGGALLVLFMSRRSQGELPPAPRIDPDVARRLEAELRE